MSDDTTQLQGLSSGNSGAKRNFAFAFSKLAFTRKPSGADYAQLNHSFVNSQADVLRVCNGIYLGHAFCAQMRAFPRSIDNFYQAQHIGVDMDTDDERSSFGVLLGHPFIKEYGAIVYETFSHTPQKPRARIVFLLDEPIQSVEGYRLAQEVVTGLFDGADTSATEPSRIFLGNGRLSEEARTEGIWFDPAACLPVSVLRTMARRLQAERDKQRERWDAEIEFRNNGQFDPGHLLGKVVKIALQKGERNNLGYWFARVLKDEGLSRGEAEALLGQYQAQVANALGKGEYTVQEAMQSVRSAYR